MIAVPTARLKIPLPSVSMQEFHMEIDPTAPATDAPANEAMAGPRTAEIHGNPSKTQEGRMEVDDTTPTMDPPAANEDIAGSGGTPGTGAD
jgi:hypothetical protein